MAVGSILMAFLLTLPGGLHNTMYFVLPGLLVFGLMMKYMPEYKRVNLEHNLKVQAAKKSGAVQKIPYGGLALVLFLFLCAQLFIQAFPHICHCFLLISAMRSLLLQVC